MSESVLREPVLPPRQGGATRRLLPALTLKQIWFQLHWFIGITAGTVLVVIGLTGAVLSFRDEWLDLLNPGVRQVAVQAGAAVLTPAQLAAVSSATGAGRPVASITVFAPAARTAPAARIGFAPPPGQRRGETIYVNPYTGARQPALRGADFFEWIESLHRWLLLPRDAGRTVAGSLALCLLGMALSGLYLRWPRRPLAWRNWLTFDPALRGRSFLWGLHSVLGTWMLVVYLVSTSTGIYWGFDFVRDHVEAWAGGRPGRDAPVMGGDRARGNGAGKDGKGHKLAGPVNLAPAWSAFEQQAGAWQTATLRVPERASQPVQISWLAADAPHERARNRMVLAQGGGKASLDERYDQLSTGAHFLSVIYPLHLGTYFGLPGRIVMMLGGLSLPAFAVTGWMLYLGRRRQSRAVLAERAALAALAATSSATTWASDSPRQVHDTLLLAYASQSGQAEKLALRSAGQLRRAGLAVKVAAVDAMQPADLGAYGRVLFVASSFGEGEAPDGARRFARLLRQGGVSLAGLHYGVLALGDRHYERFCGFGHTLDEGLRHLGARALFPLIEVDDGDSAALARWSHTLNTLAGAGASSADDAAILMPATGEEAPYRRWRLLGRDLLNPGSLGGPLVEVTLALIDGEDARGADDWQAGALADVLPRQAPAAIAAFLARAGLPGDALVRLGEQQCTLAEALSRSAVPPSSDFASPQTCADTLIPLAPRSYSLASLPQDGVVQLLVRQERHADAHGAQELGLASGWLTALAPLGSEVELRLVANPAFAPVTDDAPCIFIGNGSGFAGLRAHLRSRARAGQRRNWLLFGERQRAHDHVCASEIDGWLASGFLERLDLVFSREPSGRTYVQDRLREAHEELRTWVAQGAVLYVCGSLKGMAAGVDEALVEVLGSGVLEDLSAEGRYRRDVY